MNDRDVLDGLVGSWRITGTIRGMPLVQSATAMWVLNDAFVEIRVRDGTPLIEGKPYEAVYFMGASDPGSYLMHVIDVFGAAYSHVPGVGKREDNGLVFEFAYEDGPWIWRWMPSRDGWDLEQTYTERGERQVFAIKRMERP